MTELFRIVIVELSIECLIIKLKRNENFLVIIKKCWVVLTQIWVKYGQTQPLGIGLFFFYYILTQCLSLFIFWVY